MQPVNRIFPIVFISLTALACSSSGAVTAVDAGSSPGDAAPLCAALTGGGGDPNSGSRPLCGRPSVSSTVHCSPGTTFCTGVCGVAEACLPADRSCCVQSCSAYAASASTALTTCTEAKIGDGAFAGTTGKCTSALTSVSFATSEASYQYCKGANCCDGNGGRGPGGGNPVATCPLDSYCATPTQAGLGLCCISQASIAVVRDGTSTCEKNSCGCSEPLALGDRVPNTTPTCAGGAVPCGTGCMGPSEALVCCSRPGETGKVCPKNTRCSATGKCMPENAGACWQLKESEIGATCTPSTNPYLDRICPRGLACIAEGFKCCDENGNNCGASCTGLSSECTAPLRCFPKAGRCLVPDGGGCLRDSDCGSRVGVARATCVQGVCTNGQGVDPSLYSLMYDKDDGRQNGAETDVDCGSPNTTGCGPGKGCNDSTNCASKLCERGICR